MTMMFLMIPLALAMTAGAIAAFIWAVRGGQLDDLVTPAVRILHDDEHSVAAAATPATAEVAVDDPPPR